MLVWRGVMDFQGKKANFLGDSITEGVGTSQASKIYLNRVQAALGLACARNYGIGGTRIAPQHFGQPERGPSFLERYAEMAPDADLVVVFGGTNDYGHGDAPVGRFEDRTPATFYGACHLLMQGLIQRYPKATIVFLTPLHRLSEDQPSPGNGLPLSAYVAIIKEVAGYYALPVLDLYAVSGIQPNVPVIQAQYCPDGLHPNDAGHARIASRLAGFLQAL